MGEVLVAASLFTSSQRERGPSEPVRAKTWDGEGIGPLRESYGA
jgi:hypothetical protein